MLKKIGIFIEHVASATGRKIGHTLSGKDDDSVNGILGDRIIDAPLIINAELPAYEDEDLEEVNVP